MYLTTGHILPVGGDFFLTIIKYEIIINIDNNNYNNVNNDRVFLINSLMRELEIWIL